MNYMVDVGVYPNLNEAVADGAGGVRIAFEEKLAKASTSEKICLMRRICDHIAGMTDHFAIEEYENLYG